MVRRGLRTAALSDRSTGSTWRSAGRRCRWLAIFMIEVIEPSSEPDGSGCTPVPVPQPIRPALPLALLVHRGGGKQAAVRPSPGDGRPDRHTRRRHLPRGRRRPGSRRSSPTPRTPSGSSSSSSLPSMDQTPTPATSPAGPPDGGPTRTRSAFGGYRTSRPSWPISTAPRPSTSGDWRSVALATATAHERASSCSWGPRRWSSWPGRSALPRRSREDLAANGELPHSCTFTVATSTRPSATWRRSVSEWPTGAAETLTLDPDDCFGARYAFTTASLPGDPRV